MIIFLVIPTCNGEIVGDLFVLKSLDPCAIEEESTIYFIEVISGIVKEIDLC